MTVEDARQQLQRLAQQAYAATRRPREPLQHLEELPLMQWQLDQAREHLVLACYREGQSWGAIGRALGISRQAARERHQHLIQS